MEQLMRPEVPHPHSMLHQALPVHPAYSMFPGMGFKAEPPEEDKLSLLDMFGSHLLDIRIHDPERPYHCDLCGRNFDEADKLNRHSRCHYRVKLYECDVCGKAYATHMNLVMHKRIHPGNGSETESQSPPRRTPPAFPTLQPEPAVRDRPYQCRFCVKPFSDRSCLVKHERTHGENGIIIKKYSCDECGGRFVDSSGLKKHMRTHTGERPYVCDDCNKSFATSSTFVSHKRIHSGERPYPCDFCPKKFITKSHLKTHSRVHSGEKPFHCGFCGKKFADGSSYRRHSKLHSAKQGVMHSVFDRSSVDMNSSLCYLGDIP